jgi:hypothetical protein
LLIEYPDWRRPWDERDAEMKRLFDRALQPLELATKPIQPPPTQPKETAEKPDKAKPKPKKK